MKMRSDLTNNLDPQLESDFFPGLSDFDAAIFIDRQSDLLSPLCSQLTFDGILNEVIGIKSGTLN